MRPNKRFFPAILLPLLTVLFISTAAIAMANSNRETVQIALGGNLGNQFSPATITIRAGDSVEWTNGNGFHNVVATDLFRCANGCDDDGQGGDGSASTDQWTASVTFTQTGVIDYFCEIHAGGGMTGQIVVLPNITINELRTDATDVGNKNEYVELYGDPGASLDGLTYLVIGDGTGDNSGVIEEVESLDGLSIPASGFFIMAESTFSLTTATVTRTLAFENDDNVTHLLVSGFSGSNGDDLDTDDSRLLDVMPWTAIIDAVGLTDLPEVRSNFAYADSLGFADVSTAAGAVPKQVHRSANGGGDWEVGTGAVGEGDTPGSSNNAPLSISVRGISAESYTSTLVLAVTLICLSVATIRLKRRG